MKKYSFMFILSICAVAFLSSCEDRDKLIYDPADVVASALTGPATIDLDRDFESSGIEFTWTDAKFDLKVDVDYVVSLTANDITVELYKGDENKYTITVGDLNKKLLNEFELEADEEVQLVFSQHSTIGKYADDVPANTLIYTVSPYQTSFPPIFMTGAAVGGWNWDSEVILPSSAPNTYRTKAYFLKDEAFRFFAQQNWGPTSYNYPYFESGSISNLLENADDGDKNFRFVGASGWYLITVNLKTLTVQMETTQEPLMFMTGSAVGGWDWNANYVKMKFVQEGIWSAKTEFISGEAFRFFAQQDWGPTSYNYPYFPAGTVSSAFENAEDGDKNFKFTGTTGEYTVTINLNVPVSVTLE